MLLGVLKGLIHRAHVLCDKKEDLLEELALLKDVFSEQWIPRKVGFENFGGLMAKGDFESCFEGSGAKGEGRKTKGELF